MYGTGYAYDPWIDTAWVGWPVTYGYGAAVTYTPWVGWTYGFCFGWAWGELHMQQDTSPGAAAPAAPQGRRQARDYPDRRDAPPWLQRDDHGPPRTPRGKISMNLAAAPPDGTIGGGTAGQPRVVVR